MTTPSKPPQPVASAGAEQAGPALARVRVWDQPVRWVHWLLFAAIGVLSVTGFLIEDPVAGPAGGADWIVWLKAVHKVTAYIFIALILARVIWLFQSPNRWCRWREWIPTTRARIGAASSHRSASISFLIVSRLPSSATTRWPG